MPKKIEIEIRGRKFVCPNYTMEHAMFFGTLLMDSDELRVFRDEENPALAMDMMRDRMKQFDQDLRAMFSGEVASDKEMDKRVNDEVIGSIVNRLVVRINQDIDDVRYKVARRLREVFPDLPKSWVSSEALNLEPNELILSVAIPLFGFMLDVAPEAESEAETSFNDSAQGLPVPVAIAPTQEPRPEPKGFGKTQKENPLTVPSVQEDAARRLLEGMTKEQRDQILQEFAMV